VRERASDLHHVLLRDAQPAGRQVGVEARVQVTQHGGGLRAQRPPIDQPGARGLRVHEQVLGDAQVVEHLAFLMHHADAQFARHLGVRDAHRRVVHVDRAGIGLVYAGQDLHQCRFARAVFTDERGHRAARQFQARAFERAHAAEGFADVGERQEG
jgi:hypothetical protein